MFRYIYSDDLRTANIIANDVDGVTCLVIDRETFNQLISPLDEIRKKYEDELVERRRSVLTFFHPTFLFILLKKKRIKMKRRERKREYLSMLII